MAESGSAATGLQRKIASEESITRNFFMQMILVELGDFVAMHLIGSWRICLLVYGRNAG